MTFIVADRVKETTASTGPGNLALSGASVGFRAFSSVCANNDTVAYTISSAGGVEWETGVGTWQAGNTLVRTAVIASSNANAAVNFSAGTKDVYLTVLATQVPDATRICDGRLTLTSGTPVTTADVTGATSVFFTPMIGDQIGLFNGAAWRLYQFSEITIALGTLTSAKNYDIFAYDSGGVVGCVIGPAWTSDTARGSGAGTTELTRLNGVLVNNVAISGGPAANQGRYLGTFRTTATTTTEDSAGGVTTQVGGKRFLFNQYNRVQRALSVIDTTDNWSYTTNTVRQANGAAGNRVEYVVGEAAVMLDVEVLGIAFIANNSANAAKMGVGIDSTTTLSGTVQGGYEALAFSGANADPGNGLYVPLNGNFIGYPGLGYHTLNWNEKGADVNCTFLGDNGGDGQQAGLLAMLII
ncbi:MAG TPA: hypothetical protein VGQ44_17395 [Gemmatimonadaceae bacterium]|nr:hypothetical protein [Gemmatimonadaceae bacterium]